MARYKWATFPPGRRHADDDCLRCSAQRRDLPTPCIDREVGNGR